MLLEDSTTYQAIFRKGEVRGWQYSVLEVAQTRLGNPPERVEDAFRAIQDIPRLRRMLKRVQTAASWDELLTEG